MARILPARLWGIGLLLIAGLGLAFYLVLSQTTDFTHTQQLLRRQQTLTRAEASNIMSFFSVFGESMAALSQSSDIKRYDEQTSQAMDAFVEQWSDSGLVAGIILTDKDGIVRFNSTVSGDSDTGGSVAVRDYFVWARDRSKEGEYFVGKAVVSRIGSSKGQTIVTVAAPVHKNGTFVGVLTAAVRLQPLTERYLGLLKVSDQTNVYLFGKDGELLYGPNSYEAGLNISEIFGNELRNAIKPNEEGSLRAVILDPVSGGSEEYLIAHSPIVMGDRNWLLIMASPLQNLNDITTPIFIRQISVLVLVALTVILFGILVARESQKPVPPPDQKSL